MTYYLVAANILWGFSMGGSIAYMAPPPQRSTVRHTVVLHAAKERIEFDEEESYRTRYVQDSDEARDLQNMRYEQDISDASIVMDDNGYYEYDEEDEYLDDDYFDDTYIDSRGDKEDDVGNFWSNPKPGFDSLPTDRRRTYSGRETLKERPERRQRPRGAPRPKTTFRSGQPKTPEKITDFYDRLFWYGFNPDESIAPGDKTVFGGTKGKFNGLAIFNDNQQQNADQKRKRSPQYFRTDEGYDDIMDSTENEREKDYEYEIDEEVTVSKSVRPLPESRQQRRRSSPEDDEYDEEEITVSKPLRTFPESSPRLLRRPSPPVDEYYEEERYEQQPRDRPTRNPSGRLREEDWVSSTVSSWFGPDDTYKRGYYYEGNNYERERRPRRRGKEESPWSLTNVLDGIFQVNRKEVDMNAAMYDRQMGLEKSSRSRQRPDRRRRPGYAYSYVQGDETIPAAEYEKERELNAVDVDAVIEDEDEVKEPKRKRARTVEERAAAFGRVPPSGVQAWGPSGEVGVDARTKATLDALEEIREGTRKVELKEEECIEAKEDIVVLKADFELQKKRLLASNDDQQRIRSRLRQMQMGVQEAALGLRRSKAELEVARGRLADLDDRHWALLSLYDADKAFQEVAETFREFEESERISIRLQESHGENVDDDTAPTEADSDAPAENESDVKTSVQ